MSEIDHPLNWIDRFIRRFLILPSECDYTVLTLWIAHTYILHNLRTTPRLAIISPEYGCGKSRVLEVLEALTFKGEKLDHFTRSYLFRSVEIIREETKRSPTLLLDELDTVWNGKSEESDAIRGFVNSGYRDTGFYGITEGEGKNRKPTKFRTFAPMALAGKGEIMPESVITRGIVIRMQRRSGNEVIEEFLIPSVATEALEIVEFLESWSDQHSQDIAYLSPTLPVLDRDREVWTPLFVVAELSGEEWRDKALKALNHHQKVKESNSPSRERQLLADVMKIFEKLGIDRIRTSVLITELCDLPDSEWINFYQGKPINDRSLSRRLRPYEIKPYQIRFEERTCKGYYKSEVEIAFKRYQDSAHAGNETRETIETSETELAHSLQFVSPVSFGSA